MSPRFFVTYKRLSDGQVQESTTSLGRYRDLEEAERNAKSEHGVWGSEVLSVRQETSFEAIQHKFLRVLIRTARVACAIAIALIAYAWLGSSYTDTGDVPLGQLTGNMIMSNIFHVAAALGTVWLCVTIAFGEGPEDSPFR